MSKEKKSKSTASIAISSSIVTTLVIAIILIAIIAYVPLPIMLSYLNLPGTVALANPQHIDDPFTSQIIGELVKSGTLISLKDLWSFQSDLYQTIITVLIAINALIAAFSVIYIKGTSEEKVEETTKKYMQSEIFNHTLNNKVESEAETRLKQAQKDFEESADKLSNSITTLTKLEKENASLRQQINLISQRIALLDDSESEGSQYTLSKKD